MKIDFQSHIIPKEYIKKLKGREGTPSIQISEKGHMFMVYWKGIGYPITEKFYDWDVKIRDMEIV